MKLCGAEYKAHKQGFCDRRLDPDVQEERRQFCKTMNYLEKRMSIWSSNDKGGVIIVDRCGVENVTTMVEKLYSIVKTHRNMIDLELKVCRDEVHDRIE